MPLDAHEFADVLRMGMSRSGIDARALEAHYLPLAMAIVDYLTAHLEVTLPAAALQVGGTGSAPNDPVACEVS